MYGKLFERLVLGSVLTMFGFQMVDRRTSIPKPGAFWLSDADDVRECDATLLYKPGKLVRFDIGFIGRGNPEISRDKLSRYGRELEVSGHKHGSRTVIIVDRLPDTSKTRELAELAGAEILQMSMRYWPRDLAQRLGRMLGFKHPIQRMGDAAVERYLEDSMSRIAVQDFLEGMTPVDLGNGELEDASVELAPVNDEEPMASG